MDELNPDLIRTETVKCAIDALRQELDTQLAVAPFDERSSRKELVSWVEGFKRDRERMTGIVQRRNPWAAKFAAGIPDFWDRVEKELGIR
ncbi:hypothetical protein R70006_04983 [Paraburkholderia domus]|uniref:hypothetical protein n=1 Tax=Paraburkholderia domus TaxID=2793075 RepID=UPI0019144E96|nr:hypothetical protein [Paraburkholderia domus]MBK5051781.1 hypothetical protein [Burkholderia sp. R-70006]CAE6793996.1 hypothetical protein R70006_04983 [Paraburkholderia domus]